MPFCWIKHHIIKLYGRVEVQLQVFLTSASDGGEWSSSHHGCFNPRDKALRSHWTGGCGSPRAGLNSVQKRSLYTCQSPDCGPVTTLSYPSYQNNCIFYTHLSQLHNVSRRSLNSSSPSRNNFSASLLASSSLPLFPSGLWFMDRHE